MLNFFTVAQKVNMKMPENSRSVGQWFQDPVVDVLGIVQTIGHILGQPKVIAVLVYLPKMRFDKIRYYLR